MLDIDKLVTSSLFKIKIYNIISFKKNHILIQMFLKILVGLIPIFIQKSTP